MNTIVSLDPRITRALIPAEDQIGNPLVNGELFETFEVFHQAKSGGRHTHVGSVHAPNAEMAYLFAKEQFGRRMQTQSMWVVRTTDIFTTAESAAEQFASATAPEKEYRNANMWKVRDKIDRFKKEQSGAAGVVAEGSEDRLEDRSEDHKEPSLEH
jgi:ring-1,2-phenylacetyl-CoA epoxidase subunit PaaB